MADLAVERGAEQGTRPGAPSAASYILEPGGQMGPALRGGQTPVCLPAQTLSVGRVAHYHPPNATHAASELEP